MKTRFRDGGETGRMMLEYNWSNHPLGDPEGWSEQLKTVMGIMLGSNQPMFAAWGDERITLYNDAYRAVLGGKHPWALGRPVTQVWSEIWDVIEPIVDKAFNGESTHMDDIQLVMNRNGYDEVVNFSFSYTPVRDNDGGIIGMFCACAETTAQVQTQQLIQEEIARTRELFNQTPGFVAIIMGKQLRYEFANHAYHELVGRDRVELGNSLYATLPELESQGFFKMLDEVFTHGQAYQAHEMRAHVQRYRGEPLTEIFVDVIFQPITDRYGTTTGIFMEGSDVSDRVRAERKLKVSETLHRQIFDSATDHAIVATDLDGVITKWNYGAECILGWDEEDMLGNPMDRFYTPDDILIQQPLLERQMALRESRVNDERWHVRKDGSLFWAVGKVTPLLDDDEVPVGFVKVFSDRTEQKRAGEHQRLLMDELNHRVKNTLATVQSMAAQTFKGVHRNDEAKSTFEARLFALAKAHDVLTRESWLGADLSEIVHGALTPYRSIEHDPFDIQGCSLTLNPRKTLALTMALHEMATNAVKYGALSVRSGQVRVAWDFNGDNLLLQWQELGGPTVVPPTRKGFGSRLIERTLAMELDGDVRVDYPATGFTCTASIPHSIAVPITLH